MNKPQMPVVVPKLSSIVLKELRRQIATGELRTGAAMPTEAELMERFGVSRPTIREAMRVLETDGFVSTGRGLRYGATVSVPGGPTSACVIAMMLRQRDATMGDVHSARIAVESYAARLLAESASRKAVVDLRQLVATERASVGTTEASRAPVAKFHRAVTESCGNITLSIVGLQLLEIAERQFRVETGRTNSTRRTNQSCQIGDAHERLVSYVADGDGEGAEKVWREHLRAALPRQLGSRKVAIEQLLDLA
jgi:DNA-binding FadR family transcriptional regulator